MSTWVRLVGILLLGGILITMAWTLQLTATAANEAVTSDSTAFVWGLR